MFGIGAGEVVLGLVVLVVVLAALYWTVRLAVRHGNRDAGVRRLRPPSSTPTGEVHPR